jgi:hypothetical protein
MNMARIVAGFAALALSALVFCSCATQGTKISPWMKDGQKIGTIETSPQPWGTESRYKDLNHRLMRTERHNPDGRLLAGVCIVQLTYDSTGMLTAEQHLNSNEKLARNEEGYALRKWTHTSDPDGSRIVEESFFDENERSVLTRAGFAILKRFETAEGKATKILFFDSARKPVPSTWLNVPGVVEVQYAYLQGVTPVTCAAFLNSAGKVVDRKQLSGQTTGSWSSSYTTYYYYY